MHVFLCVIMHVFLCVQKVPVRQLVVRKIASNLLFDEWGYFHEEFVSVKFAFAVVEFACEKVIV